MNDYSELKRLAEAFPDYEWDGNQTDFFNGPSGESLGGDPTGYYCVYGPAFQIDGDLYDGPTLVEACPLDQAKFICEAKAAILALVAENENARRTGAYWKDEKICADVVIDQLKAENDAMRTALEKISAYAPCSGIKDPGFTKMHMGILARDAIAAAMSQGEVDG